MTDSTQYEFTNTWFEDQRPYHERFLRRLDFSKPVHFLEIGSHEGRSTVFFSKYISLDTNSSITCIDPFDDKDSTSPVSDHTYRRFLSNIKLTGIDNQIMLFKNYSSNVLPDLIYDEYRFDYILVDGSHLSKDVLLDAVLAFEVLKKDGIMFFDDYGQQGDRVKSSKWPTLAIDSFVNCYCDEIEILHRGYHLVLRKK